MDTNAPGCGQDPFPACIDPIFGPTGSTLYWSASTYDSGFCCIRDRAWWVNFALGNVDKSSKSLSTMVRAVRTLP